MQNKLATAASLPITDCQLSLKSADGNKIQTQGKCCIPFDIEGCHFQQTFIIAKIDGIQGILGMDFLNCYKASLNINKKTLKTCRGKIKLYKQGSNTCARVQAMETVIIPPNSETIIEGKIDLPCIRKSKIGITAMSSHIKKKGCLLARSLIDPGQSRAVGFGPPSVFVLAIPGRCFCCGSLLLLVLAVRIYTLVQLLC